MEQAVAWIERFDSGGDGTAQRLYVYYLENGRATDLAEVLIEIFKPADTDREPTDGPRLGVRPAVGYVAPAPDPAAPEPETPEADVALAAVRADDPLGIAAPLDENLRIVADEVNNALVILATPRQYRMIEAMLRKLDIVPLQVLIETTIAEVTLNDELKYGVQWFLDSGNTGAFTLSEVSDFLEVVEHAVTIQQAITRTIDGFKRKPTEMGIGIQQSTPLSSGQWLTVISGKPIH